MLQTAVLYEHPQLHVVETPRMIKHSLREDRASEIFCYTAEIEQESIVSCTPKTTPEHQFLFALDTIKMIVLKHQ